MSVKQVALACSGRPLSSNVLNACIWRFAYVSTLMSLLEFVSILCLKATVRHKNISVGMFLPPIYFIQFPKNCVDVARFDIPAAIILHVYPPSVQDKHERAHRGISYTANFVW